MLVQMLSFEAVASAWVFASFIIVLLSVAILAVFPVVKKRSLADYVSTNDSEVWLIDLINTLYKIKSRFWTERNVCMIESIIVYPIKSVGKGLRVNQWEVGEFGLKYDRQYVLASYNAKEAKWIPITLRETPRLIDVDYKVSGNYFVVIYGGREFKLPMAMDEAFLKQNSVGKDMVQLWKVPVESYNLSKALPEDFIKEFELPETTTIFYTEAGHPVKTAAPENLPNTVDGGKYRHATFQDYYPLLVICKPDLSNLNVKLEENGFAYFKVTEFSFRPNILMDGPGLVPHSEDSWYRFRLNCQSDGRAHNFTTTTKCGRCQVPNIDYHAGQKMDKASPVSKTLSKYRRIDIGNKFLTYFGIYAVQHETDYAINVGDTVDVLQRKVNVFESPS